MGYKETYEAYINFSRRELQVLCKKHNLPANKGQSDLAKSLASYFKKKNSSLVDTGEASSVPAKGKSQEKTSDEDRDENELRAASPILVESSQEGINTGEAIDGIINNVISSTSAGVVLRDQDLISESPTKREEQVSPLEPSSDNINLKSQSPTKCQNHVVPSQCTCNDKSAIGLAVESPTVTETAAKPAFQLFVASDEGINLFVDLNSGPSDWVQCLKDKICMNPVTRSCSISSLVKDTNASLSSVLSENFPSESAPLESIHDLADIPTQIENKLAGIQEGDENEKMELPKTVERDSKEVCEISVSEPNSLVPCQNGDNLAGKITDPLTEELSVVGPADKIVVLDSANAEGDSKEMCEISVSEPNSLVPGQNGDKMAGKITDPLTEELSVVGPADKIVVLDSATTEGDSKEMCEISVSESNSLVPCQNGDKLAGKITDPLTEELSVVGPTDKVLILDSATGDSLFSSSDIQQQTTTKPFSQTSWGRLDNPVGDDHLAHDSYTENSRKKKLKRKKKNCCATVSVGPKQDDISVPKASDSSRLTPVKKLKRALNQGSDELSQNRKHRVVEESNKRSFTKFLRSSSKAQQDNISVRPRRSTRLVSK